MILLPLIDFILTFFIFFQTEKIRISFLKSVVIFGLEIAFITEFLSLFSQLATFSSGISWLSLLSIKGLIIFLKRKKTFIIFPRILNKLLNISRNSETRWLFIFSLLSFISLFLFSSYVKWMPWHSRLHTPVFLLFSIPAAYFISNLKPPLRKLLFFILFLNGLSYAAHNVDRRLDDLKTMSLSRTDKNFFQIGSFKESFLAVSQRIKESGCESVALELGTDIPEYIFWSDSACALISTKRQQQEIYLDDRKFILIYSPDDWREDLAVLYFKEN